MNVCVCVKEESERECELFVCIKKCTSAYLYQEIKNKIVTLSFSN